MKFSVSQVDINVAKVLKNHGIQDGGPAQKFLESEIIKWCEPYTPKEEGALIASAHPFPKPGGGYVKWDGPYAHYMYEGVVYGPNIPKYDDEGNVVGWWSPPTKHPTGKPINYITDGPGRNPLAGSHWVERMMADHADDIEKALADYTGAKPGGK